MSKKKLGKLTALWLCWELWDWCAETGNRKGEWPRWSDYHADLNCFACEFDRQNGYGHCEPTCIMPCFSKAKGCYGMNSPYFKWETVKTPKTRKKYARIIATSAYKEYVRLGGKKRK